MNCPDTKAWIKKEIYNLMDNDMYHDAHPDDISSINDAVYRFVTEGGVYDVIYRIKRDGEYRIIHSYGKHIYKEDGTRLAFIWYTDQGAFVGDELNDNEDISGEYRRLQQENERLRKEADDIGQMNMYMGYFAEEFNEPDDAPPVGLVLARGKDELMVKYATYGMDPNLFVSKYELYLPNENALRKLIEDTLSEDDSNVG